LTSAAFFKILILVPALCFENAGLGENAFSSRACRLGPKLKIASEWLGTEIEFLIFR
jgi:hypothetical protein